MDIFKLVGSVFVDTDKANESLSKIDKKASSFAETMGKVGAGAVKVGSTVVAGATAIAGATVAMANDAAASMDTVDKASQRMNISAEYYQELAHAANLSGVEMSTLEKAAKNLKGTDLSMDDAINEIYSLGTAEERSAKAAELFGEAAAYKMSPMLNASGKEMAAMRQEAHDLGLVFSEEDVKAGAILNDTLSNVKDAFGAMATHLGVSVMPIVQTFADMIIANLPTIQGMFDSLGPVVASIFENIVPPIMALAETLLPVIFELIQTLLPPLSQIIQAVLPVFVSLLQAFMPFMLQIAQAVLPVVVNLMTALLPILQPIISLLQPILDLVMLILEPLLNLINNILPPIISLVTEIATGVLEKIRNALTSCINFFAAFRENVRNIFEQIKNVVKNPINTILSFINGLIRGITAGVNGVIRALNRFHINVPGWVTNLTGISTFGFNLAEVTAPQIPLLAKGGIAEEEGSAIVGDAGPELLQLPKGASITPLNGGSNGNLDDRLDDIVDLLRDLIARMNLGIYLDGKTLVGKVAPEMDKELGRIAGRRERWA